MIERREDLCLAPEACHAIGIVDETVWQNLQRDITPELRIARAIHLSHAAGTNRREDLVGAESSTGSKSHKGGPDELVTLIVRSEEHTSELQSRGHLVCRLLLEKKKKKKR